MPACALADLFFLLHIDVAQNVYVPPLIIIIIIIISKYEDNVCRSVCRPGSFSVRHIYVIAIIDLIRLRIRAL